MVDPLAAFMRGHLSNEERWPVPLVSTSFDVSIEAGLAVVETRRVFSNTEDHAIEAALSFPVPRVNRFGTPDLFLYSVSVAKGDLSFFRLVEVKRPRERISQDQQEELDFLISLGLPARVLRLSER